MSGHTLEIVHGIVSKYLAIPDLLALRSVCLDLHRLQRNRRDDDHPGFHVSANDGEEWAQIVARFLSSPVRLQITARRVPFLRLVDVSSIVHFDASSCGLFEIDLSRMVLLRHLTLNYNPLGDEGLDATIRTLSSNLYTLRLSGCELRLLWPQCNEWATSGRGKDLTTLTISGNPDLCQDRAKGFMRSFPQLENVLVDNVAYLKDVATESLQLVNVLFRDEVTDIGEFLDNKEMTAKIKGLHLRTTPGRLCSLPPLYLGNMTYLDIGGIYLEPSDWKILLEQYATTGIAGALCLPSSNVTAAAIVDHFVRKHSNPSCLAYLDVSHCPFMEYASVIAEVCKVMAERGVHLIKLIMNGVQLSGVNEEACDVICHTLRRRGQCLEMNWIENSIWKDESSPVYYILSRLPNLRRVSLCHRQLLAADSLLSVSPDKLQELFIDHSRVGAMTFQEDFPRLKKVSVYCMDMSDRFTDFLQSIVDRSPRLEVLMIGDNHIGLGRALKWPKLEFLRELWLQWTYLSIETRTGLLHAWKEERSMPNLSCLDIRSVATSSCSWTIDVIQAMKDGGRGVTITATGSEWTDAQEWDRLVNVVSSSYKTDIAVVRVRSTMFTADPEESRGPRTILRVVGV